MDAALITDFGKIPQKKRYYIRLLLTDPAMRELYADWGGVTRLAIAQMRMHNASNPGDTRLAELVGELSVQDAWFRQWWAAHDVATRDTGTKHLRHPRRRKPAPRLERPHLGRRPRPPRQRQPRERGVRPEPTASRTNPPAAASHSTA
jgi:hypothetical protein